MVPMEDNYNDLQSSCSWWWHSHNCSHQSQWLQTTLAELDKKTMVMLNLIQEDGDTFAKRAEMYYKRRPELIKMVEDFHRSYRSLAEKYDHLIIKSQSIQHPQFSNSSSASNILKQPQQELQTSTDPIKNSKTKPEINGEFSSRSGMMKKKINGAESDDSPLIMGSLEREKMWNQLRLNVSTLIEDNLRQQDELIKRNEEKREAIEDLCLQINSFTDENRDLKNLSDML